MVINSFNFYFLKWASEFFKSYRATILRNDNSPTAVVDPVSIAVDSNRGVLFWLDQGGGSQGKKVGRADLNGQNAAVVLSSNIGQLDLITVDVQNQRIYFSEGKSGRVSCESYFLFHSMCCDHSKANRYLMIQITSANYDGKDRNVILNDQSKQPRGLAYFSNNLFYADTAFQAIMYAPISGGRVPAQFSSFKNDLPGLINIKAFTGKTGFYCPYNIHCMRDFE